MARPGYIRGLCVGLLTLLVGVVGLSGRAQAPVPDLPTLRYLYAGAVQTEGASNQLLQVARAYRGTNATLIAYRGVAEAVQARYLWSPLAKLRAVREAQRQFTRAVALEPTNVEARFLRYTVETNVPHYLGYSQHLAADRDTIMRGARHYPDLGLDRHSLQLIRDFMLLHGNCTPEEERMLREIKP